MKQLFFIASFLIAVALPNFSLADDAFQTGIAVVDITPPVPYRMSGYFSERLSTGIKDPLFAKAIVFRQGKKSGAIVFCDLIGLSKEVSTRARKMASDKTKIPISNIAICATHSHTGPLYFGALRNHFHQRALLKSGKDEAEKIDYPTQLVQKIVEAIEKADKSKVAVSIESGNAIERRVSFNRRFHMKDGGVRFNPGQKNPNIVRVAGPIDPQVGLISFKSKSSNRSLGAILSFALHLDTVGGTEYSGDYPKFVQDHLKKVHGEEFVAMFGAGTCGDINHVDVTVTGRRTAKEIGSMLADTTTKGLATLESVSKPSLEIKSKTIEVPLQNYDADEIATAKKNMDKIGTRELSFLDQVKSYKITALQERGGKTLPIEVQAFRISNDVAIVTLPGEVFVDLGLAIKTASPFKTTLIIELTNDTPGYIPTRKAFAEGSYETVNSRIAPGGGEKMVETANKLLKELKAAKN